MRGTIITCLPGRARWDAGLGCCQPYSVEWHSSQSGAGGAVFLSGRSVERQSDYGHFGSVDWRARVRIKVSGHLCIKCSCDTVSRRGDRAKVASWRRLGLGRVEGVSVAWGGPRARRESSGVGCPCPRLGSGEARSCPLSGPNLGSIEPHQAFAALCWLGLPAEIRSLGGTPNYGPRQSCLWNQFCLCNDNRVCLFSTSSWISAIRMT
jgi:hypothetical protein